MTPRNPSVLVVMAVNEMGAEVNDAEAEAERGGSMVAEPESEEPIGSVDLQTESPVIIRERISEEEKAATKCIGTGVVLEHFECVADGDFHGRAADLLLHAHSGLFMICHKGGKQCMVREERPMAGIRLSCSGLEDHHQQYDEN